MDGEDAKWRAATDDIRRLETASPGSALLLMAKSVHYFNLALFHEAGVEAGKSAERDPLSPRAQEWLAYLLTRAGEMDASIAAWRAALALQPWRDIALYGLCDSYAFTHRIAEARDIANDLQRIAPVDDLRECEAEIDVAVHDYAGARKIVDVMAGEDSDRRFCHCREMGGPGLRRKGHRRPCKSGVRSDAAPNQFLPRHRVEGIGGETRIARLERGAHSGTSAAQARFFVKLGASRISFRTLPDCSDRPRGPQRNRNRPRRDSCSSWRSMR